MTTTPLLLSGALEAAVQSITDDGELSSVERKRLMQIMEDLSAREHVDAGYLRRARLALLCANEVLDKIQPHSLVYSQALSMLRNGLSALGGNYDLLKLRNDNGVFHTGLIDLFDFGEAAFTSVYAGMACFSAINTILYDVDFELMGRSEKEVPPDDWDASFYAALAKSGSAIWEGKGGGEQRRKFWLWYLQIGIPLCWNVQIQLIDVMHGLK
ncbi:Imm5 family immunity protein [Amantichitinum ursilacus]|uniref:Immunity protein Imm5 domain-containing protein n=1 Tax=Amantichitinum ursilacus TaxID=857265 RepID=A0A0N1JSL4_9NEIS|nr:Imm5 family immunity protein [Amantichitinum ursilacus]KPC52550.1 hypothetical protein WG78_11920 [Amantichitinum ursilacus]